MGLIIFENTAAPGWRPPPAFPQRRTRVPRPTSW